MKVKEVLDRTVQFFKDKKIETPRLDTEILLSEALGFKNRVDLYLKYDQPLKDDELNRSRDFVRRRSQGEPVAYIIGKKDFFGFTFQVSQDVLIPRPETELLVEEALSWCQTNQVQSPQILDLGCGSGCIGLSMLKKLPDAQLVSVDKSSEAIAIAETNAKKLDVKERVQFITAAVSFLDLKPESFDLILANPPYIAENDPNVQLEVKTFEPYLALFSEENGYQDLIQWSEKALHYLKPLSFMGFEMGSLQGERMKKHFADLGAFGTIKVIKDLAGLDRHIIGEKNG